MKAPELKLAIGIGRNAGNAAIFSPSGIVSLHGICPPDVAGVLCQSYTMLKALKRASRAYRGMQNGRGEPCEVLADIRAAIKKAEAEKK